MTTLTAGEDLYRLRHPRPNVQADEEDEAEDDPERPRTVADGSKRYRERNPHRFEGCQRTSDIS